MTKILVVDDEPHGADSLAILFEALGHDVRVACQGAQALPMAADFVPHLIFLDLLMPGVDGLTAARQIRDAPGTDPPFIVARTGMKDCGTPAAAAAAAVRAPRCWPAPAPRLPSAVHHPSVRSSRRPAPRTA